MPYPRLDINLYQAKTFKSGFPVKFQVEDKDVGGFLKHGFDLEAKQNPNQNKSDRISENLD